MSGKNKNVLIVYPYIPHYRVPIFNEIGAAKDGLRYHLLYSNNTIEKSIKSNVDSLSCSSERILGFSLGVFLLQWIPLTYFGNKKPDAVIFLGNPYYLSTWIYAIIYRYILGKKIVFWTHGWLDHEFGIKAWVRKVFYSIADVLFLYGNRAKSLGVRAGFSGQSMTVVYNSLDFEKHNARYFEIKNNLAEESRLLPFGIQECEIFFCCVARITSMCRFDIAVRALARIKDLTGKNYKLVLIGSGPEAETLENLSAEFGVSLFFLGETYDEAIISRLLYFSRAIVSPGKAGLTVMHGLTYGTPVISHKRWKYQMPEAEAIVDGISGSLIDFDSVDAMVSAMLSWINTPRSTLERNECRRIIIDCYNPKVQSEIIKGALFGLIKLR